MSNTNTIDDDENIEVKKHTVRHADGGTITIENYSRTKAIKLMCSECMGFESDTKGCTDFKCPLFPYRGERTIQLNRARYDEKKLQAKKERLKDYFSKLKNNVPTQNNGTV